MSLGVKLSDVLSFTRGQWVGASTNDLVFTGVSVDSRSIQPGELFVAIQGPRFDGNDFIDAALKAGALGVITDRETLKDRPAIVVKNGTRALGDLARQVRRQKGLTVLAITGSMGKTTVKEMARNILIAKNRPLDPLRSAPVRDILATQGNLNNEIGLPLTILSSLKMELSPLEAVLEMGASKPGDIQYLAEIARPDVGLVTAIGEAHLEFFKDLKTVAHTKAELFQSLGGAGVAVANQAEPLIMERCRNLVVKTLFYGSGGQIWLKKVEPIRLSERQNDLSSEILNIFGQKLTFGGTLVEDMEVEIASPGEHNAFNALAATAAAVAMGCGPREIKEGLANTIPLAGRLKPRRAAKGFWALDDSYNANPTSTRAALNLLASLSLPGPKGAILGDMLELGPDSGLYHQQIGRLARNAKLDFLALVGAQARAVLSGVRELNLDRPRVAVFDNPAAAADWVKERINDAGVVLVKGSRAIGLERAVAKLLEK
ncbi:MAG: UDP-N-acetylmuramoyl-tripeptide--D-alanyl-D-alanine ligase [Deltaproteobacteria bacterium]|jgi:UDP-N-acetylmuramoyl-tripeptide--D-alanyl-D-alanine ligase|nr:UDP-N-acetylmuramoyl-tripeptide--D-alanyl-D-alanine ligase [Deltaproteobacteria bacterium]